MFGLAFDSLWYQRPNKFRPSLKHADPSSRVVNPELQTDPDGNGVYFRCMRVWGTPAGGTRNIVAE